MSEIIDYTDANMSSGTSNGSGGSVSSKKVILFWASWHEGSIPNGPMDTVLKALASSNRSSSDSSNSITFGRVNVDENPMFVEKYQIQVVPTFVLINQDESIFDKIEGNHCNDIAQITQNVQRLIVAVTTTTPSTETTTTTEEPNTTIPVSTTTTTLNSTTTDSEMVNINERIQQLVRTADVMLFIKGTIQEPKCGFTRQLIELLHTEKITEYGTFNILKDEMIRSELKKYSNWPTYPQIYVKGELIGGLDILKEIIQDAKENNTTLQDVWNLIPASDLVVTSPSDNNVSTTTTTTPMISIEERCRSLLQQERIMLFMKGLPSTPRCGFSRQIVSLLDTLDIPYGAIDILQDEEIRQTLKILSDWPTYPQLYVNGELIGGLDIVQELYDDGTLKDTLME